MGQTQANNSEESGLLKPLSFWEKTKIGAKSFVKGVAGYIPHALIMAPLALGGMMVLANVTGWGWMQGIASLSVTQFVQKAALGIAIGSAVTGGIMAHQTIKANNEVRDKEIEAQERALLKEKHRARGQEQEQGPKPAYEGEVLVQHDLPYAEGKLITGPGLVS